MPGDIHLRMLSHYGKRHFGDRPPGYEYKMKKTAIFAVPSASVLELVDKPDLGSGA